MADLYTSKTKSYPSNNANAAASSATSSSSAAAAAAATSGAAATNAPLSASGGGAFTNWQFAMDAKQYVSGGLDVPACYQLNNGQPGDRVTSGYTVMPAADFCSCAYKNYDP